MGCFVIAEAGVNHNGDPALALRLVEAAAAAGADAVKFQTFDPAALARPGAPKARYQDRAGAAGGDQRAMLEALTLPREVYRDLKAAAEERGLVFLSTAFDEASLRFLAEELAVTRFKIASGEITNAPLLRAHALYDRPMLVSTGMATLGEIEFALAILAHAHLSPARAPMRREEALDALGDEAARAWLAGRVTLLHCVSDYPAADDILNLNSIPTLEAVFGLPVGYSDHSAGVWAAPAAVALGARVIEKHFTLDRSLPGPDHRASLEPDELARMIAGIRTVERALGRPGKPISEAERATRRVARRGIVATRPIAAGEPLTAENMAVLRPAEGADPFSWWQLLGRSAPRAYAPGEPIDGA
ncbi:MAG: N-acetylneuraminate synthase [Rhodothalassiaceae bacterium]|nr:MAG: N-acetylneuraminate synthase [Rhodothalassiaceae bacterium]